MKYPLSIILLIFIGGVIFFYRGKIVSLFPRSSASSASEYFAGEELKAVLALENNDEQKFQEALKNGADINKPGAQGVVPYLYFIWKDNSPAMVKLFKSGVDFHYRLPQELGPHFPDDFGWVPAANAHMLKNLLDAGLDPNFRPRGEGSWPLLFFTLSTVKGNGVYWESLELLISRGADINAQTRAVGGTALRNAIDYENFLLAKYLVDHGANPDIKDKQGRSIIDILKIRKEQWEGGAIIPEVDDFLDFLRSKGFKV